MDFFPPGLYLVTMVPMLWRCITFCSFFSLAHQIKSWDLKRYHTIEPSTIRLTHTCDEEKIKQYLKITPHHVTLPSLSMAMIFAGPQYITHWWLLSHRQRGIDSWVVLASGSLLRPGNEEWLLMTVNYLVGDSCLMPFRADMHEVVVIRLGRRQGRNWLLTCIGCEERRDSSAYVLVALVVWCSSRPTTWPWCQAADLFNLHCCSQQGAIAEMAYPVRAASKCKECTTDKTEIGGKEEKQDPLQQQLTRGKVCCANRKERIRAARMADNADNHCDSGVK